MTLLITIFAAVIATVVWYVSEKARKMKVGVLCYMYWGAGLMWLVDAIFEYSKLGAEYFSVAADEMMNDAYLGFSAVVLGLVIWVVILLIKDPKNIINHELCQK